METAQLERWCGVMLSDIPGVTVPLFVDITFVHLVIIPIKTLSIPLGLCNLRRHHTSSFYPRTAKERSTSELGLGTQTHCISSNDFDQRLLKALSPSHGRGLIYVWAIEQDELSKRSIPTESSSNNNGQDVMVPWVLKSQQPKKKKTGREKDSEVEQNQPQDSQAQDPVFNRYYHMFAQGELRALVCEAAEEMDIQIGSQVDQLEHQRGMEIIQDGWERSNYYIELRFWERR